MATVKQKLSETLSFKVPISIAALIGLIGGLLLGLWDSITVITKHAHPSMHPPEMLLFSLYSISIYAIIGCVIMTIIGAATSIVIQTGRYNISKSKLAGVFIGLFTLLVFYVLFMLDTPNPDALDIIKNLVFCIVIGLAVGSFSAYVLNQIKGRNKLVALCISLLIYIPAVLYGSSWLRLILLANDLGWKPSPLLASVVSWLLVSLLAAGLYFLSLFILRRCDHRKTKLAGLIMLAIMTCVFAAVSLTGPF